MKKLIFIFLIGFMMVSKAEASSFIFTPKIITVQAGKTFTLPVIVDGADSKNYTVRLSINFPPELLEVTSFTFDKNWIALSQPGYDVLDNKQGELVKTGGFPKGFSGPVAFGAITFLAKGRGEGIITLGTKSFILNRENRSTLESRPQVLVVAAEGSPPKTLLITPLPDLPQGEQNLFDVNLTPQVQTSGAGLTSKVAPGEFLPLSVKLLNFGNRNKVDVTISYKITDLAGKIIYSAEETVAVETTATFVKTIQIPFETPSGRYIAQSSIVYSGQVAPATTEFPFTVERKILGLFQNDFYRYGGITILVSVLVALFGYTLIKRRRRERFAPLDYSDIPRDQRTFYEILSDTITQMRLQVGDKALTIAMNIPGLKINKETGRVLDITGPPAKIIATLVSEYEKSLGKKVSFFFRSEKKDTQIS